MIAPAARAGDSIAHRSGLTLTATSARGRTQKTASSAVITNSRKSLCYPPWAVCQGRPGTLSTKAKASLIIADLAGQTQSEWEQAGSLVSRFRPRARKSLRPPEAPTAPRRDGRARAVADRGGRSVRRLGGARRQQTLALSTSAPGAVELNSVRRARSCAPSSRTTCPTTCSSGSRTPSVTTSWRAFSKAPPVSAALARDVLCRASAEASGARGVGAATRCNENGGTPIFRLPHGPGAICHQH